MHFALLLLLIPNVSLGHTLLSPVRLTVPLNPDKTECFSDSVEKDVKEVQIDFASREGAGVKMIVTVNEEVRFEDKKRTGTWLTKNIDFDNYTFCFVGAEKKVFFELWHMKNEDLFDEKKLVGIHDRTLKTLGRFAIPVAEMAKRLDVISHNLRSVESIQLKLRPYQRRDLDQATDLSNAVVFWSMFVSSFFVFMSIGMAFAVRTLFEEDSLVGRILRKGKLD